MFSISYYKRGNLETDRILIAKNYLKTYFIIDLISAIPVELITENDDDSDIYLSLKYFKLIRLIKLLRGRKINAYLDRLKDYIKYT